jgi:hypothetical protein
MTKDEKIQYLANLYYLIKVDGKGEVARVQQLGTALTYQPKTVPCFPAPGPCNGESQAVNMRKARTHRFSERKGFMADHSDYRYVAKGRMVDENTSPLLGVEVTVLDKDLLANDNLGTCVTDANGCFQVDFTGSDYRDGPFEGRPDIFVKYVDPSSGKKGQSKVFEELKGDLSDDDSVETMDLGDIVVS